MRLRFSLAVLLIISFLLVGCTGGELPNSGTYAVSGIVLHGNVGVKDVIVTYSGKTTGVTTTAADGTFSIHNLRGQVAISVSKDGWEFLEPQRAVSSATHLTFEGTPIFEALTISGRVTRVDNSPISNAIVFSGSHQTKSDSNGNWSLTIPGKFELLTVEVHCPGWEFQNPVVAVTPENPEVHFIGTPLPVSAPQITSTSFVRNVSISWEDVRYANQYELRTNENWGDISGLLYKGPETTFAIEQPNTRDYTLYLKSIHESGDYSGDTTIAKVSKPEPPKPNPPNVTPFFTALWIEPDPGVPEDIIGHGIYITLENGVTVYARVYVGQRLTYESSSGTNHIIEVTNIDIVGEGPKSDPISVRTTSFDW